MVVLITGVSSGFGRAFAVRLVKDGHKVYGTVRRDVSPIEGVTYLKADVRDEMAINAAFRLLMEKEGRIDVFINNAGIGIGGPLEFCAINDIQTQMDVNFMGMVRWLSQVIPVMRAQGSGKIICISSIGGRMGLPYQGAYSASKFAMEGYCEALRQELRHTGVRVIVVAPGDFSTGFTARRLSVHSEEAAKAYPSYYKSLSSIEYDEIKGLKPEYLASIISKIVRKRTPYGNYVVASFLQHLSVYAKRVLPGNVFGWLISRYYGI